MGNYITLGDYNPKYKYIFFYILTRLPYEYFFGDGFPEEMKIYFLRKENLPSSIFVYDIFKYLGMLIFGLINIKFEFKSQVIQDEITKHEKKEIIRDIVLIYHETKQKFSFLSFIAMLIIYIIAIKISEFFYFFGLTGLDFWTLQLIFICLLNIILFKIKIYFHQKIAISIILIFSTLMKTLTIISIYENDNDQRIYKEHIYLLFVGVISFLIIFFIDSYALCRIKWYLDLKFISTNKLMIHFGFLGFLFSIFFSIISSLIKCKNDEFSSHVCTVYEEESEKYFDHFLIFFHQLWSERATLNNIAYLLILLLKLFLTALYYFFSFLIVKFLSPEYFVSSDSILYFIIKLICLIYYLATNTLKNDFIFECLTQLFSLLGTIIYLELIELNFCDLNYNLKKNIKIRAKNEALNIFNIDDQSSEDD